MNTLGSSRKRAFIFAWLDVRETQIFNAPVEAWQAAYHAASLFQKPSYSADRHTENTKEEINKFLVCFSKEHSMALFVYKKLEAYLCCCHFR
jgi:hypothetical protein